MRFPFAKVCVRPEPRKGEGTAQGGRVIRGCRSQAIASFRLRCILAAVLWGLVVLVAWSELRGTPLQAQGSARAAEPALRVKLLCDLARAIQWPATNAILTVALVKYSDEEAGEIRRVLASMPQAPWRELWVTNYSTTVHPDVLKELPGCGILALSQAVGGRFAETYIRGVSPRLFLTVGDGFRGFAGMINYSQDGSLTYDSRKIEEKGLRVPQALFDSYKDRVVAVSPTRR